MSATHARVDKCDVIYRIYSFRYAVCLPIRSRNIIRHILFQPAFGMKSHPYTPQRIFHHIADHPMRSEQLCGGGLLVTLQSTFPALLCLGIRFTVCYIELIQPAHNFNVQTVIVCHSITNVSHETLIRKQIFG